MRDELPESPGRVRREIDGDRRLEAPQEPRLDPVDNKVGRRDGNEVPHEHRRGGRDGEALGARVM